MTETDRKAMVDYENARAVPLNFEFAKDILAGVHDHDGRVSLFTLWKPRPCGGQDMGIGAVRAKQIRQYFNAATQQEQTS